MNKLDLEGCANCVRARKGEKRQMRNDVNEGKKRPGRWLFMCAAYAATLGLLTGLDDAAAATRTVPSSDCHAEMDNVGSTLKNSGALSNSAASSVWIYCPMMEVDGIGLSNTDYVGIYGDEGVDGSNSRTCACLLNPVSCFCSVQKNWVDNSGGMSGLVAGDLSTSSWGTVPEQKFGYVLHSLSQNSSLAGMLLTD